MKKAQVDKIEADMAARILQQRSEIAMTMLEKLQGFVLTRLSEAEAGDENWAEMRDDTEKLWNAVQWSVCDLFTCCDELASVCGHE